MCSINGFSWKDEELVRAMNRVTAHRGPDATAVYTSDGVSFGHNRLAILDPSGRSAQPMQDATGRYTIVFNGQIYNFKALRKELAPYPFRSIGDTEVILAAYLRWGAACVERFNGMFAFAIWNSEKRELFVARDHVGIKPLYYFHDRNKFIFSSEIKALLEHPLARTLNRASFGRYMQLLYPPSQETMIEGIHKLPAASRGVYCDGTFTIEQYWAAPPKNTAEKNSSKEWRTLVERQVDASVEAQLVSDRPLGIYLSGGIDSSVVLDAVSRVRKNIDTFSVGFNLTEEEQGEKFNADFELARRTARHYGTRHHEVLLSAQDGVDVFERAVWHLDQPIANATILPMFTLAAFAKKTSTVVLGGDGGDELFGGYERYRRSYWMSEYQRLVPAPLRSLLSASRSLYTMNIPPGAGRMVFFMAQKSAEVQRVLAPGTTLPDVADMFAPHVRGANPSQFENWFMAADRETWLMDESLPRTDTMAMSSGLEARVPLLDKDLIELAVCIPVEEKLSIINTKIVLKEAFRHRLPAYLFMQPKRGWFSPGAKWLRTEPFASFVREALLEGYWAPTSSLFNWQEVRHMLAEHTEGRGYHLNVLWAVLTFQVWARQYKVGL